MIHLFQHGTGAKLATIKSCNLSWWCETYGYVPHRRLKGLGWIVASK